MLNLPRASAPRFLVSFSATGNLTLLIPIEIWPFLVMRAALQAYSLKSRRDALISADAVFAELQRASFFAPGTRAFGALTTSAVSNVLASPSGSAPSDARLSYCITGVLSEHARLFEETPHLGHLLSAIPPTWPDIDGTAVGARKRVIEAFSSLWVPPAPTHARGKARGRAAAAAAFSTAAGAGVAATSAAASVLAPMPAATASANFSAAAAASATGAAASASAPSPTATDSAASPASAAACAAVPLPTPTATATTPAPIHATLVPYAQLPDFLDNLTHASKHEVVCRESLPQGNGVCHKLQCLYASDAAVVPGTLGGMSSTAADQLARQRNRKPVAIEGVNCPYRVTIEGGWELDRVPAVFVRQTGRHNHPGSEERRIELGFSRPRALDAEVIRTERTSVTPTTAAPLSRWLATYAKQVNLDRAAWMGGRAMSGLRPASVGNPLLVRGLASPDSRISNPVWGVRGRRGRHFGGSGGDDAVEGDAGGEEDEELGDEGAAAPTLGDTICSCHYPSSEMSNHVDLLSCAVVDCPFGTFFHRKCQSAGEDVSRGGDEDGDAWMCKECTAAAISAPPAVVIGGGGGGSGGAGVDAPALGAPSPPPALPVPSAAAAVDIGGGAAAASASAAVPAKRRRELSLKLRQLVEQPPISSLTSSILPVAAAAPEIVDPSTMLTESELQQHPFRHVIRPPVGAASAATVSGFATAHSSSVSSSVSSSSLSMATEAASSAAASTTQSSSFVMEMDVDDDCALAGDAASLSAASSDTVTAAAASRSTAPVASKESASPPSPSSPPAAVAAAASAAAPLPPPRHTTLGGGVSQSDLRAFHSLSRRYSRSNFAEVKPRELMELLNGIARSQRKKYSVAAQLVAVLRDEYDKAEYASCGLDVRRQWPASTEAIAAAAAADASAHSVATAAVAAAAAADLAALAATVPPAVATADASVGDGGMPSLLVLPSIGPIPAVVAGAAALAAATAATAHAAAAAAATAAAAASAPPPPTSTWPPASRRRWSTTEVTVDPETREIRSLRVLIMSEAQYRTAMLHPGLFQLVIIDDTFGLTVCGIKLFVLMCIDPVSHKAVPIAYFLWLSPGSSYTGVDEEDGAVMTDKEVEVKVVAMVWMWEHLRLRGFPVFPCCMSDKDAPTVRSCFLFLRHEATAPDVIASDGTVLVKRGASLYADACAALTPLASAASPVEVAAADAYLAAVRRVSRLPLSPSDECFEPVRAESAPLSYDELRAARRIFRGVIPSAYPFLVRGLAATMLRDFGVARTASLSPACDTMSAFHAANAFLDTYEGVISNTPGTPLFAYTSTCCVGSSLLCTFHMQQSLQLAARSARGLVSDKSTRKALLLSLNRSLIYANVDEEGFEAAWTEFQATWSDHPTFLSYFEKNWMRPRWKSLWVPWFRSRISTYLISTSTDAERYFNPVKNELLKARRVNSFLTVLLKLVGRPSVRNSTDNSYAMKQLRQCIDVRTGEDAPADRVHVERMRKALYDVWNRDGTPGGAVTVVDAATGDFLVLPSADAYTYVGAAAAAAGVAAAGAMVPLVEGQAVDGLAGEWG